MRKLLIFGLLFMSNVGLAQTVATFHGDCSTGNTKVSTQGLGSTNTVMGSYPQCLVTVNVHGGGIATIYSSGTLAPLSNPFTATTSGAVVFYADVTKTYDITYTGGLNGGFPAPYTLADVTIGGGGGGGGTSGGFITTFSNATTVTVPGTTHKLGTSGITVSCFDGNTPADFYEPGAYTINPTTFDVVISFTVAKSGYCALIAGGGGTGGGGGGTPSGLTGVATFNGVSDAKFDTTCSTISGSTTLTCTDAPFSSCPVGLPISVTGGAIDSGSNVVSLITRVIGCGSSSVVTMAANSTHTIASPGTRWGTDNFPQLKAQYTAAGAKTFVIPPGNYLINTSAGTGGAMVPTSGTEIIFQKGANIFWVGPLGSPAIEGSNVFIFIPDGTVNVHIRIDGIINGDNVSGGPGVPSLNQSQLISIFNAFTGPINNINIDGTGLLQFLYGFDVHSLATGTVNFSGLRINVSGKGTNINSPGRQSNLTLVKSFGMETASQGAIITNNTFDASGGISLGGAGGACPGDVVSNNTFLNTMRLTNLFVGSCAFGATVTGNAFYVAGSSQEGISISCPDLFSQTGGSIYANNTFTCGGVFPNQGQAAIASGGPGNNGSFFYNNTVASDPGVPNSYCNFGVLEENSTGVDTFVGGFYTDSGHGLADFNVQGSGVSVLAIGVQTAGNGPIVTGGGVTIDPKSSFITPSGILYGSGLGTGFTPAGASLTTTAATSDNVTITGVTSATNCTLTATNASAATNIATTYVSAKTTNQITVTHVATSGMTYDIQCFIK